jgi:uncharacterized membrane protein
MFIFNLFFLPVMAFTSGIVLSGYNPNFSKTHSKYTSQNGMNLSFLKFNEEQWNYFLLKLSKKFFSIFAILSLTFNLIIDLLIFKNSNQETSMYKFAFWIVLFFLTFIIMIYKTKKINKTKEL